MRNTSHPQGKSSMKHRYLVTKYSCVKDLCAVLTPARHVLRIHSSLGAYFSLKFPLMNNTWFLPLCESLSTCMSWLGRAWACSDSFFIQTEAKQTSPSMQQRKNKRMHAIKPNEDREAAGCEYFPSMVKAIIMHAHERLFWSHKHLHFWSNSWNKQKIIKTLTSSCSLMSTMQNTDVGREKWLDILQNVNRSCLYSVKIWMVFIFFLLF